MEENLQQSTQIKNSSSNLLVYILLSIVIILLVYIGYIYNTKEVVKKQKMENEYIKKEQLSFNLLPYEVQEKYVLKSQHEYQIAQLNATIQTLKNSQQVVEKIVEVEKVVVKESHHQSEQVLTESQAPKPEKSKIYQTYTCKTLSSSSEYINKECEKDLKVFLDNNKEAKRFEVIGLIDREEFHLVEKLEDVYGKERVGNLSKYAQTGLARQRVIEASWIIRKYVGETKPVNTVNYSITQKSKRGFVVRAYY